MRCFNHPDEEAVGMCKECNKGLCRDCANEVEGFIYCRAHAGVPNEPHADSPQPAAPKRAQALREQKALPAARPVAKKPSKPKAIVSVAFKELLLPAMVGGIVGGVPSGIPFLNLLILVWVFLGGAAAAYFATLKEKVRADSPVSITASSAALVGAASGFFAALVAFTFGIFFGVNFWQPMFSFLVSSGASQQLASLALTLFSYDPSLDVLVVFVKLALLCIILPVAGALGGAAAARLTT